MITMYIMSPSPLRLLPEHTARVRFPAEEHDLEGFRVIEDDYD